ncbi:MULTISPECIES: DUF1932 domain-containing protein [Pelosinus]|uniref:Phosphogluconate dehydrogenase, NAD-binding protein n=1 Tax=Pelosinus fermentans B4 TaxID=1149862 RepID=I9B1J7_9FIRM|nr:MULTISPECIES: DUF1932 domain-containing protein [Pelosinus]EIW19012.1 Phosphogluconate dehydrogenase, NAD-binding protein [Pelosinus fermentans B4]EIW21778.1 Phosphogluconate dehydrogenase, NAD-binding protein [Pelosinus fermentans A11]OAM95373.1 Phosphogluconate dehydrogenase, NAD-binding protein [Pelosinus fermentans DSM 17108]SDR27172.1 3-hydroxyisobutyrate dehydrogenase [Pelosinus fermentans]
MKLVFIGFGEAAYNIAVGLKSEGFGEMGAFDVCAKDPIRGKLILERAKELGVVLFDDLSEACQNGEFIFSLTSAKDAVAVAKDAFQYLKKGQVYIDMNSAAPTVEEQIERLPRAEGVLFCDAGVMGTVPGNRHKVPMFLSGDGATAFAEKFASFGMNLTVLEAPAGGASAIKMFKSVVMKGLPQLMFESFEGAQKYGVLDILVESLRGSLEGKSIQKLADTFIARTLIHAARRSAEMKDVVNTLETLNVDASMSKATVAKLDQMAGQDWMNLLGEGGSKLGYQDAMKKYMNLK